MNAADIALIIAVCSTRPELRNLLMDALKDPSPESKQKKLEQFAAQTGVSLTALQLATVQEFVLGCYDSFQKIESKFAMFASDCTNPPCPDGRAFQAMANGLRTLEAQSPKSLKAT